MLDQEEKKTVDDSSVSNWSESELEEIAAIAQAMAKKTKRKVFWQYLRTELRKTICGLSGAERIGYALTTVALAIGVIRIINAAVKMNVLAVAGWLLVVLVCGVTIWKDLDVGTTWSMAKWYAGSRHEAEE